MKEIKEQIDQEIKSEDVLSFVLSSGLASQREDKRLEVPAYISEVINQLAKEE